MKIILIFCIPFLAFSQLTPCEEEVANATGSLGEFIPQCEEDGSYSPIQCWASTGYCWCVDSNGIEIPGTAIAVWEGYPNCNQQIDSLNVLFIGNSYTSANNLPNIEKVKGTINIKLDDEDFEATNPGVWSTTIETIKVPNNYTGWDDYKKDKPL